MVHQLLGEESILPALWGDLVRRELSGLYVIFASQIPIPLSCWGHLPLQFIWEIYLWYTSLIRLVVFTKFTKFSAQNNVQTLSSLQFPAGFDSHPILRPSALSLCFSPWLFIRIPWRVSQAELIPELLFWWIRFKSLMFDPSLYLFKVSPDDFTWTQVWETLV